ncbi:integrase arm-type DNA-binding domain-containing protein [Xanthomonas campestris pv. campestris]|nr:integrase arm-type DNA-binding domain-containing protein [Xanthomonas campestris pv. campestris]MEB2056387.1 integrase arm-type DNA-binding domain-containing protein [Xanthomonas campestris pv. campestris]
MARPINRLSARAAQTLTEQGYHHDGGGLYLLVGPTGAKSWVFRYQLKKRRREMGLGSTTLVSLQEARRAAMEQRRMLLEGRDPITARLEARSVGISFGECADALIESQRAGWKNDAQADQWTQSLRDYGPDRDMPVADIDTVHVMACLSHIWTTKTETASRLRARIERVLDWAKVHGHRIGENPARWRGHLDNLLPKPDKVRKPKHHAAMPYPEVPAFMAKLRERESRGRTALQFTILTAARTEEITGACWDEFDLGAALWTVPAGRMKGGRDHVVPLSGPALAILRGLDQRFPPFAMSDNTMLYLVQRPAPKGYGLPFTVHGFRSSFRDWAAETQDTPNEVVEMALAHAIRNKAEAAYRRGALIEKRRLLMHTWADYLMRAPKPSRDGQLSRAILSREVRSPAVT